MNEFLEVQFAKNLHLKLTFYNIFNKGFLLLSSVDLEEEQITELLENVLHFLRVEKEVLGPQNVEYVGTFTVEHSEFVSYEQCAELLKVGVKKPHFFNNSNGLMWAVNYVVKTHFTSKTLEDDLTFKLLHLFEDKLSSHTGFDNIVYLWSLSRATVKDKIKLIVEQHLDNDFTVDHFRFALFFGVTDKERFFVKTLEHFSKYTEQGYSEVRDGIPMHTDESATFSNFVNTLYTRNLAIDEELLGQVGRLPDHVTFFLFPEKFNYDNFDPLWLLFYSPANERSNAIYERLSKIKKIKEAVRDVLKSEYNQELAEVYVKHFL